MKRNQRIWERAGRVAAMLMAICFLFTGAAPAFAEGAEAASLCRLTAGDQSWEIMYRPLGEDYALQPLLTREDAFIADLIASDTSLPGMNLSLIRSENWTETERLSDLSQKEIQAIQDMYLIEDDDPTFEEAETENGDQLIVIRSSDEKGAIFYTILHGYEIELRLFPGAKEKTLSQKDLQSANDFFSGIAFRE